MAILDVGRIHPIDVSHVRMNCPIEEFREDAEWLTVSLLDGLVSAKWVLP
jgi:hypothetical protein